MSDAGWEGRLKLAAKGLDTWLSECTPIQSWVHGDVKSCNVMEDAGKIAMCDFQYVGKGCPMKDIAYFLCSCGIANEEGDDSFYLQIYYNRLCTKLNDKNISNIPTMESLTIALELAYCDYQRFMCGWGNWGSDIRQRVKATLDKIDNG